MPTNVFFNHAVQTEQQLYEDLVVEALQIYGHEVYYIPRKLISEDDLFGEDPINVFEDAFPMEMWMEQLEGYEGEKEMVAGAYFYHFDFVGLADCHDPRFCGRPIYLRFVLK